MEFLNSQWTLGALKPKSTTFEGWASVFNNVDNHNDCISFGAFNITLMQWKCSMQKLPMLWEHDKNNVIGEWEHIIETPKGLYVKGNIDTSRPNGAEIYQLLKDKKINGLSIGYTVRKTKQRGETRYLQAIDLYEISLVISPANREAIVETVGGTDSPAALRTNL